MYDGQKGKTDKDFLSTIFDYFVDLGVNCYQLLINICK